MIYVIFLISHCLSSIIEVNFNDNSKWEGEFQNSSNNTFRIKHNDQVQYFFYIKVELDIINPKFMLLAEKYQPISNPFSPILKDGENVDATNQYENRQIRFLKIASFDQNIYVTTIGNDDGQRYKISIVKTKNSSICQNDCSGNGICQEQGCFCAMNQTGIDCSYFATPIIDKISIIENQNEKNFFTFFTLPTSSLESQQFILKFKTNNSIGLQILFYKTQAIINPFEQLSFNPKLCDIFQVSKNKDLELLLMVPETFKQRQRINFGIKTIFPNFILQDLEISIEEYTKEEIIYISDTIIIIISISCVVFVSLIIVFCCYKHYQRKQLQRRMMMQNQEALHSGQDNHPIIPQQIQLEEICQKNFLQMLSSKEINPDEYCSICLEPLKSALEVRQTRCHHNFHTQCINLWLEKAKHECPICRQQLELKAQDEIIRT
ncbi:unnamed protein product [Paramecium primaurelia]|uniref:RING-type domain-containing protein n=1 Tax=Paramecium primaurelia TaxID=5886 RepID=A0A8S1NB44_PARPR|nr:unnamed protein product [Paramecium primaurelia]